MLTVSLLSDKHLDIQNNWMIKGHLLCVFLSVFRCDCMEFINQKDRNCLNTWTFILEQESTQRTRLAKKKLNSQGEEECRQEYWEANNTAKREVGKAKERE